MNAEPERPTDELDELLQAQSLGQLSESQRARLEQLVRDDPQARRRYLSYMRVEAQLQWRYSSIAKTASGGAPPKPQLIQRSGERTGSRRVHRPVLVIAAAVACVAAAVFGRRRRRR